MLTRNYDSMTVGYMTILPSGTPTEADWLGGKPGVLKNHDGAIKALTDMQRGSYSTFGHRNDIDNHSNLGDISPTLLVGSNDAEETYNDYKLDILDIVLY